MVPIPDKSEVKASENGGQGSDTLSVSPTSNLPTHVFVNPHLMFSIFSDWLELKWNTQGVWRERCKKTDTLTHLAYTMSSKHQTGRKVFHLYWTRHTVHTTLNSQKISKYSSNHHCTENMPKMVLYAQNISTKCSCQNPLSDSFCLHQSDIGWDGESFHCDYFAAIVQERPLHIQFAMKITSTHSSELIFIVTSNVKLQLYPYKYLMTIAYFIICICVSFSSEVI